MEVKISKSLSIEEAIDILSENDLKLLSEKERKEQLDTMMYCEDWTDEPLWSHISLEVKKEFAEQTKIIEPFNSKYNSVLKLWLRSNYLGAQNEFLLDRVRSINPEIIEITGQPHQLLSCPCCGFQTLDSHGDYDICKVCWWEDDGQDNNNAYKLMGGPNHGMTLIQSRINFLKYGIYDPSRKDLQKIQEPKEKYVKGRTFVIDYSKKIVTEPSAAWQAPLSDEK